jgi:shikimate dehydrogenase
MAIGAVNCAVRHGEKFIGENTDGKGFLKSLREVVDPEGKQVVMFGAGGAARAIGVELALAGATRIIVLNRGEGRGRMLVDLLNRQTKTESFKRTLIKFRRKPTSWSTRPRSDSTPMLTVA